jgi:hypothetical protein
MTLCAGYYGGVVWVTLGGEAAVFASGTVTNATLTLTNSAASGNYAGLGAGGYNLGIGGTGDVIGSAVVVTNVTSSYNQGGGMYA